MPTFQASALPGQGGTLHFSVPSFPLTSMPTFWASALLGWEGAPPFSISPIPKCVHMSAGSGGFQSMSTFWASTFLGWGGTPHFSVPPFPLTSMPAFQASALLGQGGVPLFSAPPSYLQAYPCPGPLLFQDGGNATFCHFPCPKPGCKDCRCIPAFSPANMPALWAPAPLRQERMLLSAFSHLKPQEFLTGAYLSHLGPPL